MSLVCSLSNETPETPVVSPVSGHIFERRLIEKYISANGTDPMNGESLTVEQLVQVKSDPIVRPRTAQTASIPSLLKMLQDEWDAVMLQNFTSRQQLHTARQELSHAMYQHDAACRVIARLSNEVTAARQALATLKPHAAQTTQESAMEQGTESEGGEESMTPEVIAKLTEMAANLTANRKRKGKAAPEHLTKVDSLKQFKQSASHISLHSGGTPGITCVDIQSSNSNMIVTGGMDKTAVVFDRSTGKQVATLKGHSKRVNRVIYHPTESTVVTCSADSSVRVWSVAKGKTTATINTHQAAVTDISLHATGDYVLSVGQDKKWAFSDIRSGRTLCEVIEQGDAPMTCARFHPDGLIFGTGSADSMVKIWDLKEQANVANFPGHKGSVGAMSFSENGYYLATAADDGVIKLWDLRKLKNFKTIELESGYQVKDLSFDRSGTYLAVAGTDVRAYVCKAWSEALVLHDHTDMATGVRFGADAAYIASVGMDRALRLYNNTEMTVAE